MFFPISPRIFIVKAVLTGNIRRLGSNGRVITTLRAAHKRTKAVGQIGIAPTEIIQDSYCLRVRANGNDIADRFVNGRPGHPIWIEKSVIWADAVAKGNPTRGIRFLAALRDEDGRIARTVVGRTNKRLNDRAALYFVIVAPDDILLTANIGMGQKCQQHILH